MWHPFRLRIAMPLLALTAFVLSAAPAVADDQVHAFHVGSLWPGDGEPIADAVLLVQSGRILDSGSRDDIEIPDGAIEHDLGDAVIVPGLVIAESSLGVSQDDERTLTPEVRAIDGFDPFADQSELIAAGVTTVQLSPGLQRLMPGQGAVVKLSGENRRLSESESLRVILSSGSANAPRIYEPPVGAVSVDNPLKPTRPQISESLAARVTGLRAVFQAAFSAKQEPAPELDLAALRDVLRAGRLRVTAVSSAEIRAALNLFNDLQGLSDDKLSLILSGPRTAEQLTDYAQRPDLAGIVVRPTFSPGQIGNPTPPDEDDPELLDAWEVANRLAAAGLADRLAICPARDADLEHIFFVGGLFLRGGNSPESVIRMLTANPARMLGIDSRVGRLQTGCDADFVVLTGEPFQPGTLLESTWIDGEQVYSRSSEVKTKVIRGARVYASGGDVIENGAIVVSGGKIRDVGQSVSFGRDAEVRSFPEAVIVPGFVDFSTGLGFGGAVSGIRLSTKLGDRLATDDPQIQFAREGGVTTAVFTTSGSPSPMLAFKLGDKPRLLKEPVAIRFSVSSNLTTGIPALQRTLAAGKKYADTWNKYESDLKEYEAKQKEYEKAKAAWEAKKKAEEQKKDKEEKSDSDGDDEKKQPEKAADSKESDDDSSAEDKKSDSANADEKKSDKSGADKSDSDKQSAEDKKASDEADAPKPPQKPKEPRKDPAQEPYRALFADEIPAVVEAKGVNAIEAALKLFREEFDLRTILTSSTDAWRVTESIERNAAAVSVGPALITEVDGKLINLPQQLATGGVELAFQSSATTGVRNLPTAVQFAVHHGLGTSDALAGMTQSPAALLSLEDQIGEIRAGRDADLVVLDGPPFAVSTQVLAVMIDGEWVFERGAKP